MRSARWRVVAWFIVALSSLFARQVNALDYDVANNLGKWVSPVNPTVLESNLSSSGGFGYLQGGGAALSLRKSGGASFANAENIRICLSSDSGCQSIAEFSIAAGTTTSDPLTFVLPSSFSTGSRSLWAQRVDSNGALDPSVRTRDYTVTALFGTTIAANVLAKSVSVGSGRSGGHQACALSSLGEVYCWGVAGDSLGQADSLQRALPTRVEGLPTIVKVLVAGGGGGACALSTAQELFCWGNGLPRATRVNVSNIVDFGVGANAACAVNSAGTVLCWGSNTYGSLGVPTTTTSATISAPVVATATTADVRGVVVATSNVCVESSSGPIRCWGMDSSGQAGDGRTTQGNVVFPASLPTGLNGYRLANANADGWCALSSTGSARCWGYHFGLASNPTVLPQPAALTGLPGNYVSMSVRNSGGCAVTQSAAAVCWGGNNQYGQIGDGTVSIRDAATPVSGLSSGVKMVAASTESSCAVLIDGGVKCWGKGTLGDGTLSGSLVPVSVVGFGRAGLALPAPAVTQTSLNGDFVSLRVNDSLAVGSAVITRYRISCRNAELQYYNTDVAVDISEPSGTSHLWRIALPRDLKNGTDGWECAASFESSAGVSGLSPFMRVGARPVVAPTKLSAVFDGNTAIVTYRDNNTTASGPIIARNAYCFDGNKYVAPIELAEHPAGSVSTFVFGGLSQNPQTSSPWSCKIQVRTQGGRSDYSTDFGLTSPITTAPIITRTRLAGNTAYIDFADNQPTVSQIANALWQCTSTGTQSGVIALNSTGGAARSVSFPLTSNNLLQNPNTYSCTISLSASGSTWGPASAPAVVPPNRPPSVTNFSFQVNSGVISGAFTVQDPDGDGIKNIRARFGTTSPGNDCVSAPLGAAGPLFAGGSISFAIDNNPLCALLLRSSGNIYAWIEAYDSYDAQAAIVSQSISYVAPAPTYIPNVATHRFVADSIPSSLRVSEAVDISVRLVDDSNSVVQSFRGPVRVTVDTVGLQWDIDVAAGNTQRATSERVVWFQNGRGVIRGFRAHQPALVTLNLSAQVDSLSRVVLASEDLPSLKALQSIGVVDTIDSSLPPIAVGTTQTTQSVQINIDVKSTVAEAKQASFKQQLSSGTLQAVLTRIDTIQPAVPLQSFFPPSGVSGLASYRFAGRAPKGQYRLDFIRLGVRLPVAIETYVDLRLSSAALYRLGVSHLALEYGAGTRAVILLHGIFGSSTSQWTAFPKVPPKLCSATNVGLPFNQFECTQWGFYAFGGNFGNDDERANFGWPNQVETLTNNGFAVVPVAYDFRIAPKKAAALYLAPAIERARRMTASVSGRYPVDIVAHSMGGIVAAHYLVSGDANSRSVDRLVVVGTPFGGSFNAVGLMQAADPLRTDCVTSLAFAAKKPCIEMKGSLPYDPMQGTYSKISHYLFGYMAMGSVFSEEALQYNTNFSSPFRYSDSFTDRAQKLTLAAPSGWSLFPDQLYAPLVANRSDTISPSALQSVSECITTSAAQRVTMGSSDKTRLLGLYSISESTISSLAKSLSSSFDNFDAYEPKLAESGGDGTVPTLLSRRGINRLFGTTSEKTPQPCVLEGDFGAHASLMGNDVVAASVLNLLAGRKPLASSFQQKSTSVLVPNISISSDTNSLQVFDAVGVQASAIDGLIATGISGSSGQSSAAGAAITIENFLSGTYTLRVAPPSTLRRSTLMVTLVDSAGQSNSASANSLGAMGNISATVSANNASLLSLVSDGPVKPNGLRAPGQRDAVELKWNATIGAISYEVYGRGAGRDTWSLIAQIPATSSPSALLAGYQMMSETFPRYEFSVVALDALQRRSFASDTVDNVLSLNARVGFPSINGAAPSTLQTASAIAMNAVPLSFSIAGGEYNINGRGWSTLPGVLTLGDTLSVRLTSSPNDGAQVTSTITFATGESTAFVVTTGVFCRLKVTGSASYSTADAIAIARVISKFSGSAVAVDLFSPPITSAQSDAMVASIRQMIDAGLLDLDGDGDTLAQTDAALLLRLASGMPGTAAINGVVNPMGSRLSWSLIRDRLNAICGTTLQ
jgi:pimeloyl-ACP methyl ester carboxylesterase/alpha-tubulin suppressor-like RCC1 family protein